MGDGLDNLEDQLQRDAFSGKPTSIRKQSYRAFFDNTAQPDEIAEFVQNHSQLPKTEHAPIEEALSFQTMQRRVLDDITAMTKRGGERNWLKKLANWYVLEPVPDEQNFRLVFGSLQTKYMLNALGSYQHAINRLEELPSFRTVEKFNPLRSNISAAQNGAQTHSKEVLAQAQKLLPGHVLRIKAKQQAAIKEVKQPFGEHVWQAIAKKYKKFTPYQKSLLADFAKWYMLADNTSKKDYTNEFHNSRVISFTTYLGPFETLKELTQDLRVYKNKSDYLTISTKESLQYNSSKSPLLAEQKKENNSKKINGSTKLNGKKNGASLEAKLNGKPVNEQTPSGVPVDSKSDLSELYSPRQRDEIFQELFAVRYDEKAQSALQEFFFFIEGAEDISPASFVKTNHRLRRKLKQEFRTTSMPYKNAAKYFSALYRDMNWPKLETLKKHMYTDEFL